LHYLGGFEEVGYPRGLHFLNLPVGAGVSVGRVVNEAPGKVNLLQFSRSSPFFCHERVAGGVTHGRYTPLGQAQHPRDPLDVPQGPEPPEPYLAIQAKKCSDEAPFSSKW